MDSVTILPSGLSSLLTGILLYKVCCRHEADKKALEEQRKKQEALAMGVYCYSHASTPIEAAEEANEVVYLLEGRTPPMGVWFDFEAPECLKAEVKEGTKVKANESE